MISHSLEVGTRIHQALEWYCMLQRAGVTYRRQAAWLDDDFPTTFEILTPPQITVMVRNNPDPGWKLPGNYHHRKGRR